MVKFVGLSSGVLSGSVFPVGIMIVHLTPRCRSNNFISALELVSSWVDIWLFGSSEKWLQI